MEDVELEKVRMKATIDISEPIEIRKESYTFIGKGPSRIDRKQINEKLNLTSERKRNSIYNDIIPEYSDK